MTGPLTAVAVVATGVFVVAAAVVVHPPRRRLAGRVRPYAAAALSRLGRPVGDIPVLRPSATGPGVRGRLVAALHGGADDPLLRARLAQSGRYDVPAAHLIGEHRYRQVLAGLLGGGLAIGVALVASWPTGGALAFGVLGVVAGAMRPTAEVDRAIERRRQRLRAEIPPLCQLIAVRLRANGSVVTALSETLAGTRGVLTDELADALAQHRAGRPLDEALDAVAMATPEPEAARVHRLLSGAIRHGLDAAPELLRLSRDTRAGALTRLRRDATRRRAALLVPTVGILAPLMLLFIAAPLPGLILGR
ncbi:type II secretion system F family protein [Euzebya sp.]|uniref:type II secretion system F family protein n=1 Tax=Euzebya sp. TaxID=1971409 RepID=UPI003512DCF3